VPFGRITHGALTGAGTPKRRGRLSPGLSMQFFCIRDTCEAGGESVWQSLPSSGLAVSSSHTLESTIFPVCIVISRHKEILIYTLIRPGWNIMSPHQAAFIIITNAVNVKATIFLTHKAVFHIL